MNFITHQGMDAIIRDVLKKKETSERFEKHLKSISKLYIDDIMEAVETKDGLLLTLDEIRKVQNEWFNAFKVPSEYIED
jgi:hypothetical protein